MATQLENLTEDQIRARLAEIKHDMFVNQAEGRLLRIEARRALMRTQAARALAAGKLSQGDIDSVRAKADNFQRSVAAFKAAGGTSTKDSRSPVTNAYLDFRDTLKATRQKAGVSQAQVAR